jgi:hypothetical protein
LIFKRLQTLGVGAALHLLLLRDRLPGCGGHHAGELVGTRLLHLDCLPVVISRHVLLSDVAVLLGSLVSVVCASKLRSLRFPFSLFFRKLGPLMCADPHIVYLVSSQLIIIIVDRVLQRLDLALVVRGSRLDLVLNSHALFL